MTASPATGRHPTVEEIVGSMHYLSPAPRVLPQLERLLADPNSSLFEIMELVRLDAALTSKVIRLSNSVYFGRGATCQTLADAVNRMGFREVHRLVATAAAATLVRRLEVYGLEPNAAWKESVACAFAAEMLAARVGEDLQAAYIIGLLHSVGRAAINHHLAQGGPAPVFENRGFPDEFRMAEVARMGSDQAEVGARMMLAWDFEPSVVEPIRWQYRPLGAAVRHHRMAAVLHGARFLRSVVCAGDAAGPTRADPAVLTIIRTTETELLGLLPELHTELHHARQLTELS